jgi:hypothetical protein
MAAVFFSKGSPKYVHLENTLFKNSMAKQDFLRETVFVSSLFLPVEVFYRRFNGKV